MLSTKNVVTPDVTDLCCTYDGLADPHAPASHHLLRDEDLLCWDFNAQVSTSNHDAITNLQDLIESIGQILKNGFTIFQRF